MRIETPSQKLNQGRPPPHEEKNKRGVKLSTTKGVPHKAGDEL